MSLSPRLEKTLNGVLNELKASLADNFHACLLYGSAVRGDHSHRVSDLNLLIVLDQSTPQAHRQIAQAVRKWRVVQPMILDRRGLQRDFHLFAPKFLSIRRTYRVLHGPDPLAGLHVPDQVERFLLEQATRNLSLRLVHAYVASSHRRRWFSRYLMQLTPSVFTHLSGALRLSGVSVPKTFHERTGILENTYGTGDGILADLLQLRAKPRKLSRAEVIDYYSRLHGLVAASIHWMEGKWPLALSA